MFIVFVDIVGTCRVRWWRCSCSVVDINALCARRRLRRWRCWTVTTLAALVPVTRKSQIMWRRKSHRWSELIIVNHILVLCILQLLSFYLTHRFRLRFRFVLFLSCEWVSQICFKDQYTLWVHHTRLLAKINTSLSILNCLRKIDLPGRMRQLPKSTWLSTK